MELLKPELLHGIQAAGINARAASLAYMQIQAALPLHLPNECALRTASESSARL